MNVCNLIILFSHILRRFVNLPLIIHVFIGAFDLLVCECMNSLDMFSRSATIVSWCMTLLMHTLNNLCSLIYLYNRLYVGIPYVNMILSTDLPIKFPIDVCNS